MKIDQINIFFLETELQCLAYKNIRATLSEEAAYLPFVTLNSVYDYLMDQEEPVQFLNKEVHGWLGRLLRFRKNLRKIKKAIKLINPDPKEINYHTARIDGFFSNLIVGYLQYHFPNSVVHARLIPDGAINVFSTKISKSKKRKLFHWSRDWAVRLLPDMKITRIWGDELGADVDIVDRIYCFEGVKTPYPKHKIFRVPLLHSRQAANDGIIKPKALIIGQNFLQLGTASKLFVDTIASEIKKLVNELDITDVDYIPHPRSDYKEFWDDEFTWVKQTELCSEQLIATGRYTHIISCYSSVLLNSKLIMGNTVDVYSVGLEAFPFRDQNQREQLNSVYEEAGIQFVPLGGTTSASA